MERSPQTQVHYQWTQPIHTPTKMKSEGDGDRWWDGEKAIERDDWDLEQTRDHKITITSDKERLIGHGY